MSIQAISIDEKRVSVVVSWVRNLSKNYLMLLAGAAILLLIYRLGLMLFLPLADTTEARYGEIARLTVHNGFWLMPHMDVHTPFFAKPPLSTWVSAISIELFGLNEFAARLPSLLASLLAVGIALGFARDLKIQRRWLVWPVLATFPLFFISAGAVMTDATQMLLVCSAQYCAWKVFNTDQNQRIHQRWKLAFWMLIGIGMLSKGLATWALIGLPLIAYGIVERHPVQLFRRIFDWRGALLAACIFVPWYAAAEHFYPGFIDYFIVGEHFKRFLVPGWHGDRYGTAHVHPLGFIWLYWIAAILPWTAVFVAEAWRVVKCRRPTVALERFLWCATLAPLVFFTFAHNIIWTYGLTALVPFSVLMVRWLENTSVSLQRFTGMVLFILSCLFVLCAPVIAYNVNGNSDRDLIAVFKKAAPPNTALIYRTKPEFSSNFYTRGNLRTELTDKQQANKSDKFVVIEKKEIAALPSSDKVLFTGTRRALVEQQ